MKPKELRTVKGDKPPKESYRKKLLAGKHKPRHITQGRGR